MRHWRVADCCIYKTRTLMYTSGTTGTPKGVLLTHANLLYAARSMAEWHSLTQSDIVLSSLPIYHINGQVISTITPFVSGGSVVAPHAFSVSNWWGLVIQYQCTWINMVPTIIAYLINAAKSGGALPSRAQLKSIRFGRSASAPLPPEHHREFEKLFGITVIEGMGMTESASMVFVIPMIKLDVMAVQESLAELKPKLLILVEMLLGIILLVRFVCAVAMYLMLITRLKRRPQRLLMLKAG